MYPRHRFDSLTDGIFAVAMTLLVLEIRLPDGADPHTSRQLLRALASLWPTFWPYVLSFVVLGGRWRDLVEGRTSEAPLSDRYVWWGLAYLLLVTLVPFSTLVLGRYASLGPSVWLYAANFGSMAFCAWRLAAAAPGEERGPYVERVAGLVLFVGSGALAVSISFLNTPWASAAFALNVLSPVVERFFEGRFKSVSET